MSGEARGVSINVVNGGGDATQCKSGDGSVGYENDGFYESRK